MHNQAVMEFGALQCKKMSPECSICDLSSSCAAYQAGLVNILPIKKKIKKKKKKYFNYLIVKYHNNILITRRSSGIWQSLYEFPLIEGNLNLDEIINNEYFQSFFQDQSYLITNFSELITHQLSHQVIYARFIHLTVSDRIKSNFIDIDIKDFDNYPIPRLIDKYIKSTGI